MNRAERRKQMKEIPGWMKDLQSESRAYQNMVKHGLTPKDLEKAKKEAFNEGIATGKEIAVRTVYAAALLTLREQFGFGNQRAIRFLTDLDQKVCYTVDSDEVIDKVFDEFGFKLKFAGYDFFDGRIEVKKNANDAQ